MIAGEEYEVDFFGGKANYSRDKFETRPDDLLYASRETQSSDVLTEYVEDLEKETDALAGLAVLLPTKNLLAGWQISFAYLRRGPLANGAKVAKAQ